MGIWKDKMKRKDGLRGGAGELKTKGGNKME